jgi:hypothetical protein
MQQYHRNGVVMDQRVFEAQHDEDDDVKLRDGVSCVTCIRDSVSLVRAKKAMLRHLVDDGSMRGAMRGRKAQIYNPTIDTIM